MLTQFSRTELLLGKEAMDKLANSKVAVFGVGGVGGYVCEALARSGVGSFDLIDDDKVCDHAADISELTIQMAGKPYVKELEHIKAMAKESMVMLVDSIEAYVNLDLTKARKSNPFTLLI